jgi:putative FmdB family regulatory protein
MATYGYQCDFDGPFDITQPIGTAPELTSCPTCGEPAARVYTVPMLGLANRGRMAVLDHVEASRTEPAVVSSPPPSPGGRPGASAPRLDPRTSRLPRP